MNLKSLTGRPLWRNKQQGKLLGVCAGLAEYFNVPVNLVRLIAVISLVAGVFFITVLLYVALGIFLDDKPLDATSATESHSARELLESAEAQLKQSELKLQAMESYVTSETFSTRDRFRNL